MSVSPQSTIPCITSVLDNKAITNTDHVEDGGKPYIVYATRTENFSGAGTQLWIEDVTGGTLCRAFLSSFFLLEIPFTEFYRFRLIQRYVWPSTEFFVHLQTMLWLLRRK